MLPTIFLSILKLQALLSNPFGRRLHQSTDFPVDALRELLRHALDAIDEHLSEGAFAALGVLPRTAPML